MATIIQNGQPLPQRAQRQRKRYLPEAVAAANAAGEILVQTHGQQEWILQVMEAVQQAVHNGVTNLGQSGGVQANAMPGDQYRFRARTKEELLRDAHQAADSRHVDPRGRVLDPAMQRLGSAPLPEQQTSSGLVLPAGVMPAMPQQQEPADEGAQGGHDDGPVQWLL